MWRFTMTVPGPNGSTIVIDDGYSQWHADGTEMMNSGAHAPKTSNFCLGVWAQTGPRAYKLNHFPLPCDATGTAPQGPIDLVANVTMKDHDHLSGPFTLDVYLWDGNEIVNASGAPIAHVTGTLNGTRVTTETTVPRATLNRPKPFGPSRRDAGRVIFAYVAKLGQQVGPGFSTCSRDVLFEVTDMC